MDDLLPRLDHTFLKMDRDASSERLKAGAELVKDWALRAYILPPQLVRTVTKNFPEITVGTVVGFPLGFGTIPEKIFSIQQAREDGAKEVDVVLDLFALANDNFRKIEEEVDLYTEVANRHGLLVKLILEVSILTTEQITNCVRICLKRKPYAIKTGTGYHRPPVTKEQVKFLKELSEGKLLVKASGGIDSLSSARELVSAGADIIGTSHTERIIRELGQDEDRVGGTLGEEKAIT